MKKISLTGWILVAIILGMIAGYGVHIKTSPVFSSQFASQIRLLTKIFLFLVQMIIAPLVFSTLVVGIAKLGNLKTVGRVGGRAFLWFISASLVSLLLGMLLVDFFQPGKSIHLSSDQIIHAKSIVESTQEFSLEGFIDHVFPKSVVEAMASNSILQLVVFSIFFGVATAAV